MTELKNEPPISELENEPSKSPSHGVMLISILLLISALLLSSVMLVHYASIGTKRSETIPMFTFSKFFEKGKSVSTPLATNRVQKAVVKTADTPELKPKESPFSKLFGDKDSKLIRWPKLKLTGFGKSTDGEGGFAIINGKQILLNNQIEKATVVEIHTHGVLMEYKGEQKLLSVELIR